MPSHEGAARVPRSVEPVVCPVAGCAVLLSRRTSLAPHVQTEHAETHVWVADDAVAPGTVKRAADPGMQGVMAKFLKLAPQPQPPASEPVLPPPPLPAPGAGDVAGPSAADLQQQLRAVRGELAAVKAQLFDMPAAVVKAIASEAARVRRLAATARSQEVVIRGVTPAEIAANNGMEVVVTGETRDGAAGLRRLPRPRRRRQVLYRAAARYCSPEAVGAQTRARYCSPELFAIPDGKAELDSSDIKRIIFTHELFETEMEDILYLLMWCLLMSAAECVTEGASSLVNRHADPRRHLGAVQYTQGAKVQSSGPVMAEADEFLLAALQRWRPQTDAQVLRGQTGPINAFIHASTNGKKGPNAEVGLVMQGQAARASRLSFMV